MSGLDLLQYLSWALYIAISVLVLRRAILRRTRAHTNMALFFGAIALTILAASVAPTLDLPQPAWLSKATAALVLSWPYLLLRLVQDFSDVPRLLMRATELGLLVSVVAVLLLPAPLPHLPTLWLVLYFVLVMAYDTWAFAREAARTSGVTHRRMQAVAAGSACMGLVLLLAGTRVDLPVPDELIAGTSIVISLVSAVCYFVGFAPPAWLRRAWQEPELRAFLSRAASLPRLPEMRAMVAELERGAAASVGAPAASIGLWDPNDGRLHFFSSAPRDQATLPPDDASSGASIVLREDTWEMDPARDPGAGRAFLEQRPTLVTDMLRADPANARLYEAYRARSVLAAAIGVGERRLGLLVLWAPRAPVFANSDLELVQMLADQAAVVLEHRALIDEAARVRAREEATRLKDDFLSSAAHDLKTPLTGLVTQAQLLLRRSERDPHAPVDRVGLARLLEQSLRLRDLVLELLDVSRLEQGNLLGRREVVDLSALVRDEAHAQATGSGWHRVQVQAGAPVYAEIDRVRMIQVLTNLVENGLKYSPDGGHVRVRVWQAGDEARLAVRDEGIGIPLEDQPLVFERFHRARNVDDRRFAGLGLGLYIARGIVTQHGGRIWVESATGSGSTFHVALPAAPHPSQASGTLSSGSAANV